MRHLEGFYWYRLHSAPRPPDDPAKAVRAADQIFAAVVAAHSELLEADSTTSAALAVAWIRAPGDGEIQFLVGARPFFPLAEVATGNDGLASVLYPPGATGTPVDAHAVMQLAGRFPSWLHCLGESNTLLLSTSDQHKSQARGAFDDYVAHLGGPFAWLLMAEPLPKAAVDLECTTLINRIPYLRRQENNESARLDLERKQARYRELMCARASGMWNVRVLVGGMVPARARRTAALLCSASDLDKLPYLLTPAATCGPLAEVWQDSVDASDDSHSPFAATAELVAALARPPARELPGIRLVAPHTFDVTPEQSGGLLLGQVIDASLAAVGPFEVPHATLNRHTFVCGATGSGKSQTVRAILESLSSVDDPTKRIPWLVIEPAKAEYARMAGRLRGQAEVLVIRPGDPAAVPVSLNPLEPAAGFPLQTHIDLVRALFLAAFEAQEPFPQILSHALTRCYEDLGWDLALGRSKAPPLTPRYPTLGDLQATARQVVERIGYSQEIADNVRGFIDVRIGSLRLGTPGRFFEGGYPLDIPALLERNVVLEIQDIGDDQDKAFFIGTVLIRLVEHLRVRHGKREDPMPLSHITVVEEAHRLLKNVEGRGPAAQAVELFAGLLAEIRAYGEGLIVAEQIPSKILPDVIKNTALKVVHRLPAEDDRRSVGATMNLDEGQSRYVVTLTPGTAAVFVDGMDRPVLTRMVPGEDRESAALATRDAPIDWRYSSPWNPELDARRPCTLEELRAGEDLAEDAKFAFWIELVVLAHLVGRSAPIADRAWLDTLLRAEPISGRRIRIVAAAAGLCAQRAVDARRAQMMIVVPAIPRSLHERALRFTPERLVAHAREMALGQFTGQSVPCVPDEVWFQAGWYRWIDIADMLMDAADRGETGRHDDTDVWWRERGIDLDGDTVLRQLERYDTETAFLPTQFQVIHGVTSPSRITMAVNQSSNEATWELRLEGLLTFLEFPDERDPEWALKHIMEQAPTAPVSLQVQSERDALPGPEEIV